MASGYFILIVSFHDITVQYSWFPKLHIPIFSRFLFFVLRMEISVLTLPFATQCFLLSVYQFRILYAGIFRLKAMIDLLRASWESGLRIEKRKKITTTADCWEKFLSNYHVISIDAYTMYMHATIPFSHVANAFAH